MASGKNHERINLLFLVLLIFAAMSLGLFKFYGWFGMIYCGISVVGYWAGTFYLNPDLDIASRPYYRFGWLRFIWKPYQLLGHRSIWTHGILIGDGIRYLYLSFLITPLLILISLGAGSSAFYVVSEAIHFISDHFIYVLFFFVGNCLSSLAHIVADHLSTSLKRSFRKF